MELTARWDYFRWSVAKPHFEKLLEKLKSEQPRAGAGVDPALWDTMRWDYFRWDVLIPKFDEVLEQFKKSE